MPDFAAIPAADLLLAATRLYTGLRDNPEIADDLEPFGYTPASATAGLAAVAALREAMRVQGTEAAEADIAARASQAASAAVRAALVTHRGRARRAHPRGTAGYTALDLAGEVPDAEADYLAAARRFYETLTGQPALAAPVRGLPERDITTALEAVTLAERADDAQTQEGGEAQRATALRQAAEQSLRRDAAALAADAKDALSGKPQLREVLGLLERGS